MQSVDGAARLVAEEADGFLDLKSLVTEVGRWQLDLTDGVEAASWKSTVGSAPAQMGSRSDLQLVAGRGALERPIRLNSAEVDFLELRVRGFDHGSIDLTWAVEGAPYSKQIGLKLDSGAARDGVLRFAVGHHQAWRGTVTSLRLRLRGSPPKPVTLLELRAVGLELADGDIASAAEHPWKIDIDHDVRTALVARPPWHREREVHLGPHSRLRLQIATMRPWAPFRLEVHSHRRGSRRERLRFAEDFSPQSDTVGSGWRELDIELSESAERDLVLSLQLLPVEGKPPVRPVVFVANAEVYTPRSSTASPSVILISIDTLRADHLSLYGYRLETSPRIDRWARETGIVFLNAITAAPWTLPSHFSLLTGLYAVSHGVNHDLGRVRTKGSSTGGGDFELLAEILHRHGYATAATTGGAFVHPRFGFAQGFDLYRYWADRARSKNELVESVDFALDWMERQGHRPFFLFLHTYEVHDPYEVRLPYFERLAPPGVELPTAKAALVSPPIASENAFQQINQLEFRSYLTGRQWPVKSEDLPLVRALYDSNIGFMDRQIGRLLDGLEALGVDERTLVVLTSDHGESLGEGQRLGHVDLYDETLRVPLVFSVPDSPRRGTRIERQVRSVDVVPTILDLIGIEGPSTDGVSLVPLMQGRENTVPPFALSYSSAPNRGLALRIDNRLKYIFNNTAWAPARGREALYDLISDPGETVNRAADDPELPELRSALRHFVDSEGRFLRLELHNASRGSLSGTIRSPLVRPVGTKSMDLPCDCVRFHAIGEASFEVPPQTSYSLLFEKILGSGLTLVGELALDGQSHAFDEHLGIERLEGIRALSFHDGRWRSSLVDSPPEVGFAVSWNRGELFNDTSPVQADSALRERLEALGYVTQ